MKKILFGLLIVGFGIRLSAQAATRDATSCSQSAVKTAVEGASSGDIVRIPAGSCDWSTTTNGEPCVNVPDGVLITGATNGVTTINDRTRKGSHEVLMEMGSNDRLTNVNINIINVVSGQSSINTGGSDWRVDHCTFTNSAGANGYSIANWGINGLIDHNVFKDISMSMNGAGNGGGTIWDNTTLTNADAVYIENNLHDFSRMMDGVVDGYRGSRFVFRYNVIKGSQFGVHGLDSTPDGRSAMYYEVYGNTFTTTGGYNIFTAMNFRGGSGVVYNNVVDGSDYQYFLSLQDFRSCGYDTGQWGSCDGNNTYRMPDGSNIDKNWSGMTGYACRDQIGRGVNQTISPLFVWNNTFKNGANPGVGAGGTCAREGEHIKINRDYYRDTTSFNPTTKVYSATYKDDDINGGAIKNWSYTAYAYPHPYITDCANHAFTCDAGSPPPPTTFKLTVNKSGTGTGTVAGASGAINCGGTCAANINQGTSVTLNATPTAGSTFVSWSGGGCSGSGACTTTMNADTTVTATFSTSGGGTGGATRYVDNSGNPACSDTTTSGAETKPFCTVSYGISRTTSGDTLYVKNGTYSGAFTISGPAGTPSQHTVISAYPGHNPILQGSGFSGGRMKITGTSYIDFVGFTITNNNQGLYIDDDAGTGTPPNHIWVSNVTVHDVGQEGIAIRGGPTFIYVDGCTVYNTGRNGSVNNGEGIYVGTSNGLDTTNNVSITNCTIHHTPDEGIELKGNSHDVIVDHNTLYNCLNPGTSFSNTGGAIEIDEPNGYTNNPNHIIRNNIIHDITLTSGITKRGIRIGTGAQVYNNVLYGIDNSYSAILSNSASYQPIVYHNTIQAAKPLDVSGAGVDSKNNIGPSTTNNTPFNTSYFVDAANRNYHLNASLDATGLTSVTVDRDGFTRGNPPDMGAYEFGGAPPADTYHPGDTNSDSLMSQNEATKYGNCWRSAPAIPTGCKSGANVDYATRAGAIYISTDDGQYTYDSSKSCPACWVVVP